MVRSRAGEHCRLPVVLKQAQPLVAGDQEGVGPAVVDQALEIELLGLQLGMH